MQELKIEAYDLYDYTNQVIEAGKQGYITSTDNAKYPFNFTGYYFAVLVKEKATEDATGQAVSYVDSSNEEQTKVVSKGRPKKV